MNISQTKKSNLLPEKMTTYGGIPRGFKSGLESAKASSSEESEAKGMCQLNLLWVLALQKMTYV
jgi:hypothetical protein